MESTRAPQTHADRRSFIVGSDARIVMGDDEGAPLRLWREKRGEAEPEVLSGKPRSSQPCDRAGAINLEDRADHLSKVLSALSVYVTVILDDTAQNVPGRIDFRDAEAVLADLASDVSGTIQHAADGMAGRVA